MYVTFCYTGKRLPRDMSPIFSLDYRVHWRLNVHWQSPLQDISIVVLSDSVIDRKMCNGIFFPRGRRGAFSAKKKISTSVSITVYIYSHRSISLFFYHFVFECLHHVYNFVSFKK